MNLENVFGPRELTYNPKIRKDVRMYELPDGVVRAFRALSSEWDLYDYYISRRRPGLHQALLKDIHDLAMQIHTNGDRLSFEQHVHMVARKVFVELPRVKIMQQPWPANSSMTIRHEKKVV
ncbi:MAG: hypothetical protein AAF636_08500 [Pseudomonadota bacterium]